MAAVGRSQGNIWTKVVLRPRSNHLLNYSVCTKLIGNWGKEKFNVISIWCEICRESRDLLPEGAFWRSDNKSPVRYATAGGCEALSERFMRAGHLGGKVWLRQGGRGALRSNGRE